MIHIRSSERAPVEPARFNEAYMMHASTSPFYPMIAVLDVAAAMMDGPGGAALTAESIHEAIDFRKRISSLAQAIHERDGVDGWFFGAWQPEHVRDPASGVEYAFTDAPDELLASDPKCWTLETDAPWHGFGALPNDFCMLDPIKVTITMPGMDVTGTFAQRGIPAQIVTLFLDEQRIEIEKTGDYIMLVLFSIGMTKGKWGTLLDGLLGFKRAYDENTPLRDALPKLVARPPGPLRNARVSQTSATRCTTRCAPAACRHCSTAPSTPCRKPSSPPPTPTVDSSADAPSGWRSRRWRSAPRR